MNKEAFDRGIEKGLRDYEKTASDEILKALAKIRTILENYDKLGYHIDYELDEIIQEIEVVLDKKINHIETFKKDKRLGKVKQLIKETYEKMGRNDNMMDGNEMSILIIKLNKYFKTIKIPNNYMAIAKLKYEREM